MALCAAVAVVLLALDIYTDASALKIVLHMLLVAWGLSMGLIVKPMLERVQSNAARPEGGRDGGERPGG